MNENIDRGGQIKYAGNEREQPNKFGPPVDFFDVEIPRRVTERGSQDERECKKGQ